MHGETLKFI